MPGRNGTGPSGVGPKTGRGMGSCGGNANFVGRGGCGMGLSRGGRMGRGQGFSRGLGLNGASAPYAATQDSSTDQSLEALKEQADYFKNSLKETNQQIEEIQRRNK